MVKQLLAPKREGLHLDYELGYFERTLAEAFEVERLERLRVGQCGCRTAHPAGMTASSLPARPSALLAPLREAVWAYLGLAVDVRGRPTAPRPAQGQPRVLRRARVVGVRRDQLSVLLVVLLPALLLAVELLVGLVGGIGARAPTWS